MKFVGKIWVQVQLGDCEKTIQPVFFQTISQELPFQNHELGSLLKICIRGTRAREERERASAFLINSLGYLLVHSMFQPLILTFWSLHFLVCELEMVMSPDYGEDQVDK